MNMNLAMDGRIFSIEKRRNFIGFFYPTFIITDIF